LFFVPGVLLGQGILAGVMSVGGTRLADTPLLVWLAMVLRYAAVGWAGVRLARAALDPALVEAGRLEGACGWRLWWHYAAPQMARPLALTWYAIYLLALWEVETLVLIHPPGGETLALRIFNLLHYGHTADVNAMGLLLLGLALGPLVLGAIVRWVIDLGRGA
jgi:iron(III) transport system permease protein